MSIHNTIAFDNREINRARAELYEPVFDDAGPSEQLMRAQADTMVSS